MQTSLSFHVKIAPTDCALQFGDAARIELWTLPTPTDRAAAIGLLSLRGKVLRLEFWDRQEESIPSASFLASIAALNSAIRFTKEVAKVKFDVPDTETLGAAKLIGLDDCILRLEIEEAGARATKPSLRAVPSPKPAKGEHGQFWQQLWDFHNRPDVRHWLEYDGLDETEAKQRLCARFEVTSRTFISPDALLAKLREQSGAMAGAITAIERAKARIQAREQMEVAA